MNNVITFDQTIKSKSMKKIIGLFILLYMYCSVYGQVENIRVNSYSLTRCNEPSIAVNPTNPANIVIGANNTFCFYTFNSGETWQELQMESSFGVWGDPSLGFDSEGNLYFTHLSGEPPISGRWADRIVIQKSIDGGKTWSDGTFTGLNRPKQEDKSWMTIADTNSIYKDNIYIAWTEFDTIMSEHPDCKSRILFSYSVDKGEAWTAPISINDSDGDCYDDDDTVEGAIPAIGKDGGIYISWSGPDGILFDKSLDGGKTFGEDLFISPQIGGWAWDSHEIEGVRGNGFPQTLSDNGISEHSGNLYIVWADQRNGTSNTDIFIKKSTDKGITWNDAVRVNTDMTERPQFFPWASIDPETGKLYILFYDRRNTTGTFTDVYLAISEDGGETFSNIKISEESFSNDNYAFTGDYINLQVFNGVIYPVWTHVNNLNQRFIYSAVITEEVLTSTDKEIGSFENILHTNYPNPFKEETTISFQVKEKNHVSLRVYDSLGKEVASLVNEIKKPGEYNVYFDGSNLSSGSFFYKLEVGNWSTSSKMLLLK